MELEDVKQFIEENKDNEEVSEYLSQFKVSPEIGIDLIKKKMEEDGDIKSYIDSIKDKHSGKALETWKANNLESQIELEIKKRFPEANPKDTELQKLKIEIENMKREKTHESLTNLALKTASVKGLPVDLISYFVAQDEETTLANLGVLEQVFGTQVEAGIKSKIGDESYTPPKNDSKGMTHEEFFNLDIVEQTKFAEENPEAYQEIVK